MQEEFKEKLGECNNYYCPHQQDNVKLFQAIFANSIIYFCAQCHELYSIHKCCYFCAQIYSDENNQLDGQNWIQCDNKNCGLWTHQECEKRNDQVDIDHLLNNSNCVYSCPWCRIQKANGKKRKKAIKYDTKLVNDHSNSVVPQEYNCPVAVRQTYLDELLKKYGGFVQSVTQEEKLLDLEKLRSLVK